MPTQNTWGVRFLFLNHMTRGGVLLGTGDVGGTGWTMRRG